MADFGIGEAAGFLAAETAATYAGSAAASTAAATAASTAAASGLTVPQWIAIGSTAASLGSTGVGVAGSLKQLDAQAGMSDLAKKAALQEAASKSDAAAYNERQFRRKASFLMGQQTNTAAASGTALGVGSNLFHELDTARQIALEAENIRRQGNVGAAASTFEAGLAGYRGRYFRAQQADVLGAGAVNTGTSILSNWATLRKGGFGY